MVLRDRMETGDCAVDVCRQGGPGFFDDFWRSAGVWALGEFGGGKELGVATGAMARTQEVEETLLADGNGGRSCRLQVVGCRLWCGAGGWLGFGVRFGCGPGLRSLGGHGREGLEGDLEAVDHLAGAAGVDGVLGEAVDDGGEGDEDAGAVLDWGNLHAGDLGIDEDAAVIAVGVLDVVVIAVIFAFECGRAAALAAWGLVVVALLVATEVWNWCRHWRTPPVSIRT